MSDNDSNSSKPFPGRMDRRDFLGAALATATAVSVGGSALGADLAHGTGSGPAGRSTMDLALPPMQRVRFGLIGVGMRGAGLLRLLLAVEGAEITAICDTHGATLDAAVEVVKQATGRAVPAYTGSDEAYKKLLARDDVDAVIIATPWQWHVPMALAAIESGKQTFVEVPAALTVDDAWKLVEATERRRVHCMMLENCCYGRAELMALNMVRAGVLGELTHGEGGYIHDLRWLLKDMKLGEGSWRPQWYTQRTANAYPTHGLGPIAQCMGINRGDRFDRLVSMGAPARSFAAYARHEYPADHPANKLNFVLSDMSSTLIQTAAGRTILLQHNVSSPRPYSRINLLQGVKGTFAGYPDRLSLDDHGGGEEWLTDLTEWYTRYDSSLWRRLEKQANEEGGHGGMDFVMLWRIVDCLRKGLPLDQSVYDAAAWSVIFDLSEQSARARSAGRDFPDFTRGLWKNTVPVRIELTAT
jgi:predicted dehydrogenase